MNSRNDNPHTDSGSTQLDVDYRRLVSGADLNFDRSITRSDLGLPVGNGRMGSLVWTDRNAIKLQINRADVFAANSHTESLIEAPPTGVGSIPAGYQDYCCGCAFVDIAFHGVSGTPVRSVPFPAGAAHQHLSLYEATATMEGGGCRVRILASAQRDVMAVHLEKLPGVSTVKLVLRMLRPPLLTIRKHTATSTIAEDRGRIVLGQVFEEGDYYCSSAVAVGLSVANGAAKGVGQGAVEPTRDTSIQISFEPGRASRTVFIASAASFDREADTGAAALHELDAAIEDGFDRIAANHRSWWEDFWSKSFISVPGFRELEQVETMYLYLMASSSRASIPPKYNFGLWNTHGDQHNWGSQFWWWNQSCIHHSVYASNHIELNDPLFSMTSANLDAYAIAAEQQWGSHGIWIPETQWFDGIEELPPDVASALRDLYLELKPFDGMSPRMRGLSLRKHPFSSRWNFLFLDRPGGTWGNDSTGIYAHVSHTLVVAPKIAHLFWLRYQYTMDLEWLRERAYPILYGAAEFYRNHPGLRKEADGKYHLNRTNSHEHLWGAKDVLDDIALMKGLFPTLIRASEILGVDDDMRPVWGEVATNLAPYPASDMPGAKLPLKHPKGERTWAEGYEPCALTRGGGPESPRLRPLLEYDVLTLESQGDADWAVAMATLDAHPGSVPGISHSETSRYATEAARSGRADLVRQYLSLHLREKPWSTVLPNGLSDLEGGGSMQYLVTSSMQGGKIESVEVRSRLGGELRIRNPWPSEGAALYRGEKFAGNLEGSLLRLPTSTNEIVVLVREGTSPEEFKRSIP